MGIKKLYGLIKEHASSGIEIKNIKDFNNKVLAIDTSLLLYQYIIATLVLR